MRGPGAWPTTVWTRQREHGRRAHGRADAGARTATARAGLRRHRIRRLGRQPGLRTVQGVLEAALGTVLRTDGPPRVTVAGRTDAGVHARGQVAHVDIPAGLIEKSSGRSSRPVDEVLLTRLGGILPSDLVVHTLTRAAEGFDARFSALRRRYTYRICDDATRRDPLSRTTCCGTAAGSTSTRWQRRPAAGRSPRLRVLLQAQAGRDHDPHAQGVRVVPAGRRLGRRPGGRDRAGGRVLPLDGAVARRREPRGGGGAARTGLAGRTARRTSPR